LAVLEPGSVFAGRYKVIRPIGSGGMGAVYEAEQLSTRKRRALKVLTNRFGTDEKARERFVREATVGAEIRSDHVVDVIGAGVDEPSSLPWLAMELLDGMDLKRVADSRGPLAARHLGAIFTQLGHGLAAAHAAGVVHRDLKPENVFVARSRRAGSPFLVKILDFGISKITHEAVVSTDTATIGSPMWMSPEQINAEPVSARTDVWSLGLLAFWALSGRVYWKAAYGERVTVQALFAEQLFADIVPPSQRAAAYGVSERIPAGFDAWFGQCVAREPGQRFADAGAATRALEGVLAPWVASQAEPTRPLLPEPGAPAEASVARSEPVLSPGGGGRSADLAQMAGTTADVMSLQGSQPTMQGTSNFGMASEATDAPPEVTGMQPVPTPLSAQAPAAEPAPVAAARRGPAVGKIAAAAAIPAALAGAVVAGFLVWEPDTEQPETVAKDVREDVEPSAEGGDEPPLAAKVDVGTAEPEGVSAGWHGLPKPPKALPKHRADLSSLPAPSRVEFLGWTPDGDVAVLRLAYGSKVAARGFANYLELIVEVDGKTGSVVRTFSVDREANASLSKNDPLAKADAASVPGKRWVERRVELLLRAPEARRAPSRRQGELTLSFENVPEGTKVRAQAKRSGFELGWWGFDALGFDASRPTLHVQWVESGAAHTLVQAPVEVELDRLRTLAARPGDEVTLEGAVRVYWTADERRALVTVELEGGREVADRRWFLVEPGGDGGARKRIRD